MSTQLLGIGDLVKRLEVIADACGDGSQHKEAGGEKDEFLRTKRRMYDLLEQVRDDIHARTGLLQKRGNCFETVEKGHAIRQSLDELKQSVPKLQEIHKKAQKKRNTAQQKEELQARYQEIRLLKRHVDEANDLYLQNSTPDASRGELFGGAGGVAPSLYGRGAATCSEEDGRRRITAEEEQAMAKMKERDRQIDNQLGELGQIVDRLDPLARQIGAKADVLRIKGEALNEDVGKADEDLRDLNKKVKEVMEYEKNTNCCCQLVLGIVLLMCVGFVFHQIGLG